MLIIYLIKNNELSIKKQLLEKDIVKIFYLSINLFND